MYPNKGSGVLKFVWIDFYMKMKNRNLGFTLLKAVGFPALGSLRNIFV